jgi:molecular chaperone DnaJ
MGNPYEILGVKESATDEEIKAAYKVMVKKYHPDRHANNPLEDLAEEKLRQVNLAYDEIMDMRKGKTTNTYGGPVAMALMADINTVNPEFAEVRRDIDANRLNEATAKLQRVQTRTAEWIFLDGMISYRKGWYDDAISKIQQAVYMDPQNAEYNLALNGLERRTGYRNTAYGRGYRSA